MSTSLLSSQQWYGQPPLPTLPLPPPWPLGLGRGVGEDAVIEQDADVDADIDAGGKNILILDVSRCTALCVLISTTSL